MELAVAKRRTLAMQPETGSSEKSKDNDEDLRLPNEIITHEILTRVPLESLIQWRCVCKQWSNLIIDPSFWYLHSRQNTNHPGLIFYSTRDYDGNQGIPHLVFFDIDKREEKVIRFSPKLENDFLGKDIKILHSLNGLLLISCGRYYFGRMFNYHVYNPITGRSIILPALDLDLEWGIYCYFSLAYDPIMSKYKVVCCGYANYEYFCKIVDSNVGASGCSYSWRDVVFPKPCYSIPRANPPVFANGHLHWIIGGIDFCFNLDGSFGLQTTEQERKILRLDVSREVFDTIRYPKCYSGRSNYTLLEMGGSLCYVDLVSDTRWNFWVLKKDVENNDEWVEECSIDMGHLKSILPFGDDSLFECKPFAILSTDTKRKLIFFWYFGLEYQDASSYKYYSYDMEFRVLNFLFQNIDSCMLRLDWHANSLACF